jgi:hypothetical protein
MYTYRDRGARGDADISCYDGAESSVGGDGGACEDGVIAGWYVSNR